MGGLVRADPDGRALERARDQVGALLEEFGIKTTRTQRQQVAETAVFNWLRFRFHEWSTDRSIAGIGDPDAYTMGCAEAVLPIVAERPLPWNRPVGEWAKDDIVMLLSVAFEAMREQQARTLEDPTTQWIEVVNA